jgi:hypothetical protein
MKNIRHRYLAESGPSFHPPCLVVTLVKYWSKVHIGYS